MPESKNALYRRDENGEQRPRVEISQEMIKDIQDALSRKGMRATKFVGAIRTYETQYKLESANIPTTVIQMILDGNAQSIQANYWERIHQVLPTIPDIVQKDAPTVEITDAIRVSLTDFLESTSLDSVKMMDWVRRMRKVSGLQPIGITAANLDEVLSGQTKVLTAETWVNLQSSMTSIKAFIDDRANRFELTAAMRLDFDNALKSRNLFPSQFEKVVASYEAEHGLKSTGLTRGRIKAILFGNNKSVPKVIWNRIWEVLEIVPSASQEGGEVRPVTRIVQVLDIEDRNGQSKPGKIMPSDLRKIPRADASYNPIEPKSS